MQTDGSSLSPLLENKAVERKIPMFPNTPCFVASGGAMQKVITGEGVRMSHNAHYATWIAWLSVLIRGFEAFIVSISCRITWGGARGYVKNGAQKPFFIPTASLVSKFCRKLKKYGGFESFTWEALH